MRAVCAVVCSILVCGASASFGQVRETTSSAPGTLSAGINLRSVGGAPFSADVVKQSTQLLPDGSRALVETHGKMFRDAEGRTRVEAELAAGAGSATRHFITIVDPVRQVSMVLNVEAKTGTIFHLPAAPAISEKQLKLAAAAQARQRASRPAAGAEDLGTMTIEGFSVTGTRSTHPAEAAAGGSKAEIAITESWFSPELKVQLLSITQLPRAVTQTAKLINVVAGAPDPALFHAPAGYAIADHSQQK